MTTRLREHAARLRGRDVCALLALVALARVVAIRFFPLYDEAFISLRYAANLARGFGLVFNPGAPWEPVLGTAAPGYAVLVAAGVKAGYGAVHSALALNVLCDVVSAGLIVALLGRDRVRATLAVGAFALLPELARVSVGGMEAPLFCALALGALFCARHARFATAGTLAALCCTVRPEALLLVAFVLFAARGSSARLLRVLVPVTVLGLAYTIALVAQYGSPIPLPVVAQAQRLDGAFAHWAEIARGCAAPRPAYLALVPCVLFGAYRGLRERAGAAPFLLFALCLGLMYLAAGVAPRAWFFYAPLAAWGVALALGLEPAVRAVARRLPALVAPSMKVVPAAAIVLAIAAVTLHPRDVVTERVYGAMADWAREVDLADRRATLVASDIGAIGYYTRGTVLDSEGRTLPPGDRFDSQMDMVVKLQPDYLMLNADRAGIGALRAEDAVTREYYPVRRFSRSGATELVPRLADLPAGRQQDYLVYRRRL